MFKTVTSRRWIDVYLLSVITLLTKQQTIAEMTVQYGLGCTSFAQYLLGTRTRRCMSNLIVALLAQRRNSIMAIQI